MGIHGRRKVEAQFDIKQQSEKLEDIYEQVLARRPSSATTRVGEQP
jgi:hypothetical protein